ncbi:MAG: hypothetical protein DCC52_19350 [Chloroflexi bacterium]|nr:MAG: hypothetical protein DCC52_19350 [Chloroflexota bacterium]
MNQNEISNFKRNIGRRARGLWIIAALLAAGLCAPPAPIAAQGAADVSLDEIQMKFRSRKRCTTSR